MLDTIKTHLLIKLINFAEFHFNGIMGVITSLKFLKKWFWKIMFYFLECLKDDILIENLNLQTKETD